MKKIIGLCSALIGLLALGGPVQAQTGSRSMPVPIVVTVQGGTIAVSDGAFRATSTVTSWSLGTAGYTFAANGIDFGSAQGQFSCSATNGGLGFRCTRSGGTGKFPYTVRLVDQGSGQALATEQGSILVWVNND